MTLKQAWTKRDKLYAEARKLWAEADKLSAEADKLYAEGSKLHARADKLYAEARKLNAEAHKLRAAGDSLWLDAVIAKYGPKCKVKWNGNECILTPPPSEPQTIRFK